MVEVVCPLSYLKIKEEAEFDMASDKNICSLLRTLASSCQGGAFLELGTGTGLSTSFILDGMRKDAKLTSIDNEEVLLRIAQKYLGSDSRLTLINSDGGEWLRQNLNKKYDYIFADTWHGKYLMLEETLNMLNEGGFYIIDDILPQDSWPKAHFEKTSRLLETLQERDDLVMTHLDWGSGVVIAVKKKPRTL
ncbi:class I SAM-dependent methyltransferase [uncultured Arcticibacterium sp.]|uniref:O-methyltransferase n=1 Tax=uncultured Arcticibacterium sp. TaxID=2173042 RepID=UPI0030F75EB1